MADFYHVTCFPRDGVTPSDIEAVLNKAIDWYRLRYGLWILYSSTNAEKWTIRLRPLVEDGGTLLISRMDMSSYDGFTSVKVFHWINAHLSRGASSRPDPG
jgi:hypothetical protein